MLTYIEKIVILTILVVVCQAQDDCFITYAGCRCLDTWSYNGVSGLSGCANPDNDTVGSWCLVSETQPCVAGKPLNTLPLADNAPFDYCQTQCKIVTEDDYAGRSLFDSFFSQMFSNNNDDTLVVKSNTGRLPWNSGGILSLPAAPAPAPAPAPTIGQTSFDMLAVDTQGYEPAPTPPSTNIFSGFSFPNFFTGSTPPPTAIPTAVPIPPTAVPIPPPAAVPTAVATNQQPQLSIPPSTSGSLSADYTNAHNSRRSRHCVSGMSWDAQLAVSAQNYANLCVFEHSQAPGLGENLFIGKGIYFDADYVVGLWYDEIDLYDYGNPGFSSATGHFTQVVWSDTMNVGCGEKTDCNIGHIVVCQYTPPGNFQGMFQQKVPPLCV